MALPIIDLNVAASFVPTTFILDSAQISEVDVTSDEFKQLLIRLYKNLNRMAIVINTKTSGFYATNQFVTSDQYFPFAASSSLVQQDYRPVTRVVVNFGFLPVSGTKSVAHGIMCTANTKFVHLYGTATNPVSPFAYIPLPYASPTLVNNIELKADGTNVTVITGSDRSAFTICYIVIEFLNQ